MVAGLAQPLREAKEAVGDGSAAGVAEGVAGSAAGEVRREVSKTVWQRRGPIRFQPMAGRSPGPG